jgi:hypothetical protein
MKTYIHLTRVFVALSMVFVLVAGCDQRESRICIPVSDLEARRPFVATVDFVYVGKVPQTNLDLRETVAIGLQMQDGEKLSVGDSVSNVDLLIGFARTLEKGKTYEFPKVWFEYRGKTNNFTGKL